VVVLDFDAIQKLVDLVGGVSVDVPKRMKYTDKAGELYIDLEPGVQKLNGYNAMGFVRYRHDAESDLGRQKRQKDFLMAFKDAVFHDLPALPEILTGGQVALNGALDDKQLEALASFAHRVPQQNIRMGMVPVTDGGPGGTLLLDKRALPAALEKYDFVPAGSTGAGQTQ
jgi:anionic cell wall polymer biosynthesis LytR-Cps2A-Psr (LCP) family protein